MKTVALIVILLTLMACALCFVAGFVIGTIRTMPGRRSDVRLGLPRSSDFEEDRV